MKPPPRSRRLPAKNNYGTDPSPRPHSPSPSSSRQFREFFKVYIPAFSSHQLRVPPDFSKQCKLIPRKAVLREPNGRSWTVGMIENARGLFIRSGWREFVQDNALKYGDCLIFQYDMGSAFLVKIFGRNGCRKEGRYFERAAVMKMETEEVGEEEETVQIREGTLCPIRRRSEVQREIENKTPDLAEGPVTPKHPHCVHRMSEWWLRQPHLSACFLKHNGIKLKSKLILRNEKGKSWIVALGTKADGRLFLSSGWPKFRRDNDLRLNQRCMMEFVVDDRNNDCRELHFRYFPE